MTRTIALLAAVAIASTALLPGPLEARSAKSKVQRGEKVAVVKRTTRTAGVQRSVRSYEPFPGYPGHRDRTTVLLPNGRINGEEFFARIGDLAPDAGP